MLEPSRQPHRGRAPEAEQAEQAGLLPDDVSRKKWRITPLFSAEVVYDDNIFLTNTDRVADVIWIPSFGLIYELGDFRDQRGELSQCAMDRHARHLHENFEQSGFNQYFDLGLQYRFSKLVAKLDSSYSTVRGSNRDVNTITTTTDFLEFPQLQL